jgi:transcriptional regulator with XRE-family HTH domain
MCAVRSLISHVINVRRERHARDWSQEELADRARLSARYLGSIERAGVSASVTVSQTPHFRTIQICLNDPPATLWQAKAAETWVRGLLVVTPGREAPCRT